MSNRPGVGYNWLCATTKWMVIWARTRKEEVGELKLQLIEDQVDALGAWPD